MTIDEAIKHYEAMAEVSKCAGEMLSNDAFLRIDSGDREECREEAIASLEMSREYMQLAEWLTELKELKNSIGAVKLKDMKDAVRLLQELNTENDQLTSQLADAKRLLKAAVDDMNGNNICFDINACNVCTDNKCISCDTFKWRYTDEVLKLLGGSENGET